MKQSNLISILILFFTLLSVQCVVADNPTGISNNCLTFNNIDKLVTFLNETLYIGDYPCNKISFNTKYNDWNWGVTQKMKITTDANDEYIVTLPKNEEYKEYDIKTSAKNIYFKHNNGGNDIDIHNIKVHIAPHILLKEITGDVTKTWNYNNIQATATSTKSVKIDFGSMRNNAGSKTATIKIKSCLSAGQLATTLSDTPNGFSITGGVSGGANTFVALNNNNDITVTFNPAQAGVTTTTKNISETITISDAGNNGNNVVITLTATVNPPKTQTITWNQTFHEPLRVGDAIDLVPATINSGNTITYTSDNTNAVIENGKIIIKAAGNISITASHPGDNEWRPVSVTKTSTAYKYNATPTQNEIAYKYVKLSWEDIHEANSYDIYDYTTKKHILNTTNTNCVIKNLTSDSTYLFIIKTNDDKSISQQSTGTQFSVKTKPFPKVKNLQLVEVQQNQLKIKWEDADLLSNHELVEYLIHVYKDGDANPVGHDPDQNTSYTITNLTDSTKYRVYVGVQYRQKLDDAEYHSLKVGEWVYLDVTTKSFIPAEDILNDVIKYQGEWYRVHLNEKIDISDGSAGSGFETKQQPHIMTLNYPCENDFKYKFSASDFWGTFGKATLRIQESTNESQDNPNWSRITNNTPKEVDKEYEACTASTTNGINVKRLEFYENTGNDGKANGKAYISDIWLKIAPHIRLNDNGASVSDITVTCPDVYYDEAKEGSSIDVDFFSFLTDPNEAMTYSISGDSKNFTVAIPTTTTNEFCHKDDTDKKVSIKFKPTVGDYHKKVYNATITLKSGSQTATIKVSAKGLKHEHKLTWKNDFPTEILVGDNIDAPAYISTNGCNNKYTHTIKYSDANALFSQIEGYNYITAKKEGTTTLVARIDGTNYCEGDTITREVGVKDVEPTMSWSQNLIFVESNLEQEVTLNATSNKDGNIIYEIDGTDTDGIVAEIEGNKLYIKANTIGSVHLKAYNKNYTNVVAKNTLIVNSSADCNTIITYDNTIGTTTGISASTTIELQYPAKSISFVADMGTTAEVIIPSQYTITVKDGNSDEVFLSTTEYADKTITVPLKETVKKVTISGNPTWTSRLDINSVSIVLHSGFNYYQITTAISNNTIDFGSFDMGAGAQPKAQTIDLSYHSLPGGITFEIEDNKDNIFTLNKNLIDNTCEIGSNSVIVTCNPLKRGTHTAYLVIKTGGEEKERITLQAIVKGVSQSIVWTTEQLTTVDKDVIIAKTSTDLPVLLEIVGGNNDIVETTNNGLTIWVKNKGSFTITASHPGSDTYEPISKDTTFNSIIGTLRFDKDGEWSNVNNWLPVSNLNKQRNVAPSGVVNAEIAANATISNTGTINQINNITFDGGSLTIAATSALKANKITNENAENLILKASVDGNATLIYADGTPSATVEMYSKAKYGTKATDGHHPEWQYMGVAVKGAKVGDFKYNDSRNAWLLKWEEKDNTTGDPWSDAPLAAGTALEAWAGYSISQPTATTYTMSGQLMNSNQTYQLTRTIKEGADKQDPDCGFNLLANSYTAPIDIAKLKPEDFGDDGDADACIILYNTGTYGDWESQQGKSDEAPKPGQLTVIPVESAKAIAEQGLPTTIPSMQAFFVKANKTGATFTVDYETAVLGATNTGNQMRAPQAKDEFNVLKIMIEGENSRDQLFLLENENTSKAYDNGYEARKIFDAPRGHQMYATCEYGYASIDCSKSFIGQAIGLKGDNEGEKLTISFGIDKIKDYESLFLYDKATGKYVNIMAEEEYTFYGIRGADDNRFCIVTNPDDRNQTPPFVVIGDELAFDKSQIGTDNANIYIYDTLGRLLMTDKVNPGENYRIPDMPEGIYLVSMNGYTTKIVRK